MIIKKITVNLILIAGCLLSVLTGLVISSLFSPLTREYIYYTQRKAITIPATNLELPLPLPSILTTEQANPRVDLEKISVNRYFIIYSLIYGDQSHTAYHLYLTDLQRNKLNPALLQEIWLEGDGRKILPVAELPVIKDFPADQPLGWKIKIIVKFPYQTTRSNHSLSINYNSLRFTITEISY